MADTSHLSTSRWALIVSWILAVALVAAVATLVAPPAAAAEESDDIVVRGSGWGHGVGMSQFGAYGMARDGAGYGTILRHFYRGANVGTMGQGGIAAAKPIWVNLEMDRRDLTLRVVDIGGGGPVTIARNGKKWKAPVGTRIHVKRSDGRCHLVFEKPGKSPANTGKGACKFNLHWYPWQNAGATPTTAIAVEGCTQTEWTGSGPQYHECRYARGTLHIRDGGQVRGGNGLDLSARMRMEDYVLGIAEMPYSWGSHAMAALQAQAVAARSYARELQIHRGAPGDPDDNSCNAWCHVRDTTFDQRYVGWGQEDWRWTEAVRSTANRVVSHPDAPNGRVVRTYYSSSSGGNTENIDEVWAGSTPRPYYRSVADPWAKDPAINPNASWTARIPNRTVADETGLDAVTAIAVTARNGSGSARTIAITGPSGGEVKTIHQSSGWMRSTFGLKSIYFGVELSNPQAQKVGPFTDIVGNVHAAAIVSIYEHGITKGCNPPVNDRYCPHGDVTRGQMAAFLVRALGLPATGEDFFTDDESSVFADDINRLAASGITKGCTPTRFCPHDPVTRGQMAAFLDRAFGYSAGTGSDRFVDDDASVFQASIDRIAAAGVTKGCNPPTNDRFCPGEPVARAQMASFLDRTGAVSGG